MSINPPRVTKYLINLLPFKREIFPIFPIFHFTLEHDVRFVTRLRIYKKWYPLSFHWCNFESNPWNYASLSLVAWVLQGTSECQQNSAIANINIDRRDVVHVGRGPKPPVSMWALSPIGLLLCDHRLFSNLFDQVAETKRKRHSAPCPPFHSTHRFIHSIQIFHVQAAPQVALDSQLHCPR